MSCLTRKEHQSSANIRPPGRASGGELELILDGIGLDVHT